jgi:hypothetical protein
MQLARIVKASHRMGHRRVFADRVNCMQIENVTTRIAQSLKLSTSNDVNPWSTLVSPTPKLNPMPGLPES